MHSFESAVGIVVSQASRPSERFATDVLVVRLNSCPLGGRGYLWKLQVGSSNQANSELEAAGRALMRYGSRALELEYRRW